MSSRRHSPSLTNTPGGQQSEIVVPTSPSAVGASPVQKPPTVYSRQPNHDHSPRQSQTRERPKRDHASVSSASTASSRQTTPRPPAASIHIYSPTYSLSSMAEQGTLETPRPTRAYPTQYTRPSRSEMAEINAAYRLSYDKGNSSEEPKDHAIWILIWLSLLGPLYCIFGALYTLIVLLPLLLLTPLRLCRSACDLSGSIVRFISPILRRQLEMLCSRSVEGRHDLDYKPVCLVIVCLVAPLLSLGVAVAGWVSASFWIFAITVGNPDGTERRDDGRTTVLYVRNWWERYLLAAVR